MLLLLGACLAFMLALSEYLLLSRTSSLTLSIAGIIKVRAHPDSSDRLGRSHNSLAPDCGQLLSLPNIQSGKYNEKDPILIGTAVSEHVIREMSKPAVPLVKAL